MSSHLIPTTQTDDRRIRPVSPEPSAPPALLWPSIDDDGKSSKDATSFPIEWRIRKRQELCRKSAMTLSAFNLAVATACQRLLIMDMHFDKIGVESLQHAFERSQASDVRLLTGDVKKDEWYKMCNDLKKRINSHRSDQKVVDVQWRITLQKDSYPFLHDRFAVVDNALWHFGATVGGGHPSLNAASGPWSAKDTRAVKFFDECWRKSYESTRA